MPVLRQGSTAGAIPSNAPDRHVRTLPLQRMAAFGPPYMHQSKTGKLHQATSLWRVLLYPSMVMQRNTRPMVAPFHLHRASFRKHQLFERMVGGRSAVSYLSFVFIPDSHYDLYAAYHNLWSTYSVLLCPHASLAYARPFFSYIAVVYVSLVSTIQSIIPREH